MVLASSRRRDCRERYPQRTRTESLTLRALFIGWVGYVLAAVVANVLTIEARGNLVNWLAVAGYDSPESFFWAARVPETTLPYRACFASGWGVGRLHRRASFAVLCFAATVVVLEYALLAIMLALATRPTPGPSSLVFHLVLLSGRPLAVLLGGMIGIGSTERTQKGYA